MDALEMLWPTICAGCDVKHRGRLCAACRASAAIHEVDRRLEGIRVTLAGARYDTPIGTALQRAKYGRDRALMRHLAAEFAEWVRPWVVGNLFDAIVDVPSPWSRRAVRGFATGAVLAAAVSAATGIPVRHAVRIRHGRRNAGLDAGGRRRNLRGRVRSTGPVPGRILLVDDVVTTGATAEACARELLGTESKGVWLIALCAADPPPRDRL